MQTRHTGVRNVGGPPQELIEVAAPDRRTGRPSAHERIGGFLDLSVQVLPDSRHHDRRQRDSSTTSLRLRRTEDQPSTPLLMNAWRIRADPPGGGSDLLQVCAGVAGLVAVRFAIVHGADAHGSAVLTVLGIGSVLMS